VTGRVKAIIIRAGRNLHPGELEEAVGAIEGVRAGCVAVFPATDPVLGTERLIVLAETRMSDPAALVGLRRSIRSVTVDVLGAPPDDVVLAEPGSVLKTTSGKIRRSACRSRYESGGGATRPPGPGWWQVVRFARGGAVSQLRRWRRAILASAYAAWAWAVLLVLAPVVWLAVLVLPRPSWRWHVTRAAGRVLRLATGTPLRVVGADLVPRRTPCVLVANHASYLDGLAMVLALPRPVFFVAHGSFRSQRFVGPFLRRLGTEFVEGRLDTDLAAMERIRARLQRSQQSQQGWPVMFFPEGRRSTAPGLDRFHLGGFRVAADAGMSVVPVGIRGTRSLLSVGHRLPHHSAVSVTFGAQLLTDEPGWHGAVELRDRARRAVLDLSGERDAI
jgi:1-acyl-sn-glycerol-3-phosphate acyltransferase